jgi:hypothetical protein
VTVLSQRGVKPADPCRSRDRVQAEGPNALRVAAVDWIAHRVSVWSPYPIKSGAPCNPSQASLMSLSELNRCRGDSIQHGEQSLTILCLRQECNHETNGHEKNVNEGQ